MGTNSTNVYFDRVPDRAEVIARIRAISGWHIEEDTDPILEFTDLDGAPVYFGRFTARYYDESITLFFHDRTVPKKSLYQKIQEAFPNDEQAQQQQIDRLHYTDIYRIPEDRPDKDHPDKDYVGIMTCCADIYLEWLTTAILVDMGGTEDWKHRALPPLAEMKWKGLQWWSKLMGYSLVLRLFEGTIVLVCEVAMFLFGAGRKKKG